MIDLSINEGIIKELAEVEERERVEKQLLLEADRINEIDTLAKAHLSNHFNKEVLLAKGYTLKDIMQAQRRELVRKFVPIEQIKAISKVSDINHINGEILEQLVSLAKVNIKLRKMRTAILLLLILLKAILLLNQKRAQVCLILILFQLILQNLYKLLVILTSKDECNFMKT